MKSLVRVLSYSLFPSALSSFAQSPSRGVPRRGWISYRRIALARALPSAQYAELGKTGESPKTFPARKSDVAMSMSGSEVGIV